MTVIPLPLWQFVAMALGLVALLAGALLLGWRLGRESAGRPMFQTTASLPRPTAAELLPGNDPWAEAMTTGGDA